MQLFQLSHKFVENFTHASFITNSFDSYVDRSASSYETSKIQLLDATEVASALFTTNQRQGHLPLLERLVRWALQSTQRLSVQPRQPH